MLVFYPSPEDCGYGTLQERLSIVSNAAEQYRSAVLGGSLVPGATAEPPKYETPREQTVAFNWETIACLYREIHALTEATYSDKQEKADLLMQLSETYEVLRAAKMPRLEKISSVLAAEANQLKATVL
ncbi:MAG TPA: hypothetical protein VNC84_08280 [Gammaproteobacteria bacterium]|jgi:hypothetical protein|nr:hypothetical protein [Gammaproteobacteria bacterium]